MSQTGSMGYPKGQYQGIYIRIRNLSDTKMPDPTMTHVGTQQEANDLIERISRESYKPPDEIQKIDDRTVLLKWYYNPEDAQG